MPSKSRGGLSKREVAAKKPAKIATKQVGKTATSGTGDGLTSQYKALMKKYEKTLTPSDTENKATSALNDLTTSAEAGIAKAGQEVVPMGLITGQQKAITEQQSLKSAPLSRTIAAEQAKRSAASDVLKNQSSLLESQMKIQADNAAKATTLQDQMSLAAYKKRIGGGGGTIKTAIIDIGKGSSKRKALVNAETGELIKELNY